MKKFILLPILVLVISANAFGQRSRMASRARPAECTIRASSITVGKSCKDFYGQRDSKEIPFNCYGTQLQAYQKVIGQGDSWHRFIAPCKTSSPTSVDTGSTKKTK